ncbi:MAG TPA: DegT/DnrJ/EryC1/StrS family aminotransferase [Terriglobia bacterium]|jgi:dTDP-4-amino-4,6-dideoxygalactose transaminase|nr:DegT/DnrJ/EryC1/StrS family aminotransferase [Terriglobia bacterium]
MNVPYFDLKAQYAHLREDILLAVDRVCQGASFILGDEVSLFEREFAEYCEAGYCVAVNSGTSALHLALLSVGVQPGDEVITTANTFIATAEAISYTGAKPVFVDIDPCTANIDPALIEDAITPRTKAILPVHLYGRPADLDPIMEIAARHGVAVLEDACQAHGARYKGKRVGSLGRAAAFSFYPGKNLGAYGEGGALTTNDAQIAEFARAMRDHGQSQRYFHDFVGYNYRMDGFQGAVLRVKLKRLDDWTARRRELADLYRELLSDVALDLPQDDPASDCVYHLFVAYVDERERVREALQSCGVQTAVHYPRPVHLQKAYAALGYGPGSLPYTERASDRCLSLPLFPEMTSDQVRFAAEAVAEAVEQTSAVAASN